MTPPRSSRAYAPTRRGLLAAGVGGIAFAGCGSKHRPAVYPPLPPEPAPEPPAPVAEWDPWAPGVGDQGGRIFDPSNAYEPPVPPGYWRFMSPRVRVWLPHFLTGFGYLIDGALREIETVTPDGDTRIDPAWRGVDCDPHKPPVCVVVMDPYGYSLLNFGASPPSILVAGHQTRYADRRGENEWGVLYVAWRAKQLADAGLETRLLPALAHELRHWLTGDPFAGHPGGCCSRWVRDA